MVPYLELNCPERGYCRIALGAAPKTAYIAKRMGKYVTYTEVTAAGQFRDVRSERPTWSGVVLAPTTVDRTPDR
jgi:hypothetical protein